MDTNKPNGIADIFSRYEQPILTDWLREQLSALSARQDLISETELRRQSAEFLSIFTPACRAGSLTEITTPEWRPVLDFLASVSRSRANLGFSPSETATFVFSLKQPLFARLRQEFGTDAVALSDEVWSPIPGRTTRPWCCIAMVSGRAGRWKSIPDC